MLDGVEDAHVAGAAAEVSGEAFLDLSERRLRVLREEMVGGEDHAGRADAALGSAFRQEAPLDGVEVLLVRQGFDGGDLGAFALEDGDEAGVDEFDLSVSLGHEDGAGATFAFAAPFFGAG